MGKREVASQTHLLTKVKMYALDASARAWPLALIYILLTSHVLLDLGQHVALSFIGAWSHVAVAPSQSRAFMNGHIFIS